MKLSGYLREAADFSLASCLYIADVIAVNLNSEKLAECLNPECGNYRNWKREETVRDF